MIGCYTVMPLLGPRGGYSRPTRWQLDQLTTAGWQPLCCFVVKRGARAARIEGGFLLRKIREVKGDAR